ncbi:MAG: TolC family protein [Thermoanaerobaculia bacterium]
MLKTTTTILLIATLIAPLAWAQETEPAPDAAAAAAGGLTLPEAVRIALANNPTAARSRSQVELAEENVRLARSFILPQVTFDGRYTRNDQEVTFDFDGTEVPIQPLDDWSTSVRLAQPIYAGGRSLKAIRQARLGVTDTQEGVRETEEDVLLDVAAGYFNFLGAEALVAVERQNIELASATRDQAMAFFEAGEVTRVDVLRAESSIKGAERRLAAAQQARAGAASLLRLSLGADVPLDLERPSLGLPDVPSEDELVAMAQGQRPEVQRAEIALRVADLEVEKQRGAYLPVVTAEASFTQQAAGFPTDQFGALTVNFDVPLFTSGELASRVATAREQEHQARLVLDQTEQVVREDVRRALVALSTARTALALATDQLAAAEAEYAQIFELYRAQEATSLDVQSAEANLADARRAVVVSTLDRDLAELQVWYAAGALKPVLLEEQS